MVLKKQVSFVVMTNTDYNEIEFIKSVKKYISEFKEVKLIGYHIKLDKEKKWEK